VDDVFTTLQVQNPERLGVEILNPRTGLYSLLLLLNKLSAFTLEGSLFHYEVGHEEPVWVQSGLQCWFLEGQNPRLFCRHVIFQRVCLLTSSL